MHVFRIVLRKRDECFSKQHLSICVLISIVFTVRNGDQILIMCKIKSVTQSSNFFTRILDFVIKLCIHKQYMELESGPRSSQKLQ
jgi:hypothetical protein